jgi:acyl-coenzyme A thioesterase PaaI-like protein
MAAQSIQDRFWPDGSCFGCGPANNAGLRIQSFATDNDLVAADWTPQSDHRASLGVVCGGILATILDCHAAAAAAHALTQREGRFTAVVTKDFSIELLKPTPLLPLHLSARVIELRSRSAAVEAWIETAGGEVSVRFRGVFVVSPSNDAA